MTLSDLEKTNHSARVLTQRYLITLGLLALVVLLSQVIIQYQLSQQNGTASTISQIGRQRALSQQVAKAMLAFQSVSPGQRGAYWQELSTAYNQWLKAQLALQDVSSEWQINGSYRWLAGELKPPFEKMRGAVETTLTTCTDPAVPCEVVARTLPEVLAAEREYSALMDRMVDQVTAESERGIQRIQMVQLGVLAISAVILLAAWAFVVRPTVGRLQDSFDQLQQSKHALETRILERAEDLERANEEIRSTAHIISHDLRAPLANAVGFTDEIRLELERLYFLLYTGLDNAVPADKREETWDILRYRIPDALDAITRQSNRMERLVAGILRLSREGMRELRFEPLDINDVIRNVLISLEGQIRRNGAMIECGNLPEIVADESALDQIFQNLIGNAIKYRHPHRLPRIQIRSQEAANETMFSIADNGIGILKQDQDKIFKPFRRGSNHELEGEGVGMYYVNTLVQRHGGRIWFESQAGKGTTFFFTIKHQQPTLVVPSESSD